MDTTIEFADGTQYRVETVEEQQQQQQPDQQVEEVELDQISRAERFRDDYDRTYGRGGPARTASGGNDQRTLYNDKKGRLEPVPEPTQQQQPHPQAQQQKKAEEKKAAKPALAPTENPWNKNKAPPVVPVPIPRQPEAPQQQQQPQPTRAVVEQPATAEPVIDLEEQHAREMKAAAERAKVRRQEEEKARLEQIERAKQKAAEIEARMKAASSESTATQAPAASAPTTTAPAPAPAKKDAEPSWRERRAASATTARPQAISPVAPSIALPAPAEQAKLEPRQILARPAPPPVEPANGAKEQWRPAPPIVAEPKAAPNRKQELKEPNNWRADRPPVPKSPDAPVPANAAPTVAADKKGKKRNEKKQQVAGLDDLMTRVMGAMHAPPPDTVEDPYSLVTAKELSFDTNRHHKRVRVPSLTRAGATKTATTSSRVNGGQQPSRPTSPAPTPSDFDRTTDDRPPSPRPAWKVFTVKLAARKERQPVSAKQRFHWDNTQLPKPVHPFSWWPLLAGTNARRQTRDDVVFFTFNKAPSKVTTENAHEWVKLPTGRGVRNVDYAPPKPVEAQSRVDLASDEALQDLVDRIDVTLAKTWQEREALLEKERHLPPVAVATSSTPAHDSTPAIGTPTFEGSTTAPGDSDLFEETPLVSRLAPNFRRQIFNASEGESVPTTGVSNFLGLYFSGFGRLTGL